MLDGVERGRDDRYVERAHEERHRDDGKDGDALRARLFLRCLQGRGPVVFQTCIVVLAR